MSETWKCPKCGGEMEEGFLVSPRPLWWDTKMHRFGASGEQILPSNMSVQNLDAYRCKKCQLIVFKYDYHSPEPLYKWPTLHRNKDGPEVQK